MDKYYIYKYYSYMNNLPWYFFDNSSENLVLRLTETELR